MKLGWRVLNKKTKRSYVWALAAEDAVAYLIEDSRSAEAAQKLLDDFEGTAITDGYACYSALQKRGGRFRLAKTGALLVACAPKVCRNRGELSQRNAAKYWV